MNATLNLFTTISSSEVHVKRGALTLTLWCHLTFIICFKYYNKYTTNEHLALEESYNIIILSSLHNYGHDLSFISSIEN